MCTPVAISWLLKSHLVIGYDPGRLQGLLDSHLVGLDKLVGALAVSLGGDIHNPLRQVLIVGLPPYLHTCTLSLSPSADTLTMNRTQP
jgi:hypothetical protein